MFTRIIPVTFSLSILLYTNIICVKKINLSAFGACKTLHLIKNNNSRKYIITKVIEGSLHHVPIISYDNSDSGPHKKKITTRLIKYLYYANGTDETNTDGCYSQIVI